MNDSYILLKDMISHNFFVPAGSIGENKNDTAYVFPCLRKGVQDSFSVDKRDILNEEWFRKNLSDGRKLDIQNALALLTIEGYVITKKRQAEITEWSDYKYTEDNMRSCFNNSRMVHPWAGFKYDSFEDYIKSLTQSP